MMKRYFSILLALVISTSIVGCGNANAKSDSANASNNVTVNNVQVESEKVSDISSPEVDNSVTAQATVDEPQPTTESVSSGSLYTLPVGAKGEEWSEAQLDEYLKDCKAYQDNCKLNDQGKMKVNFDELMRDLQFEYVGVSTDGDFDYVIYWRQISNVKYITVLSEESIVYVFVDNGVDSVNIVLLGADSHSPSVDVVFLKSENMNKGHLLNGIPLAQIKGTVATLKMVTSSTSYDCGRLPYFKHYIIQYSLDGSFGLEKKLEFMPAVEYHQIHVYQ